MSCYNITAFALVWETFTPHKTLSIKFDLQIPLEMENYCHFLVRYTMTFMSKVSHAEK